MPYTISIAITCSQISPQSNYITFNLFINKICTTAKCYFQLLFYTKYTLYNSVNHVYFFQIYKQYQHKIHSFALVQFMASRCPIPFF